MERDHNYNETALLQAMASGSVAAFNSIYYRYYEAVRANIFTIIKEDAATDDLLQEVFMSLWAKREHFIRYDKISNWLFVASYNRSMNFLRRLATERTHQRSLRAIKTYEEDPEEMARQEQQLLLLEKAIEQLPPRRRKVFELCRLKGLTYEQTANELSISKNTVKEHLAKAAESIKIYMQAHSDQSPLLTTFIFFVAGASWNHPF